MKMFLYTLLITFILCNASEAMFDSIPTIELAYHANDGREVRKKLTEIDSSTLESMSQLSIEQLYGFMHTLLSFKDHHKMPTHITSNNQFLQIERNQAKEIKSIVFEGVTIDEDFFMHYCEIMTGEYSSISFINCVTDGVNFADVLDGSNVTDLTISGCNIATTDLSEVLLRINAYAIKKIDISNNNLGIADESVREILMRRICGRMCLDELILNDNGFNSRFIADITTRCCNQK